MTIRLYSSDFAPKFSSKPLERPAFVFELDGALRFERNLPQLKFDRERIAVEALE